VNDALSRIWRQMSRGKDIDLYLTIVLAFVIFCLSLFHVTSSDVVSATILVTLMLLGVASLRNRYAYKEFSATLSRLLVYGSQFLRHWRDVEFSSLISKSRRVSMLAVANYRFLSENDLQLTDLIKRGDFIRSILVNPNGVALKMAADRRAGASAHPHYIENSIEMSKARLRAFADGAEPGRVKLKYIDHLPSIIITWLEFEQDPGVMLLTLTSFKQPTDARPTFTLSQDKDSKWYQYYREYYENIWNWDGATDVHLD